MTGGSVEHSAINAMQPSAFVGAESDSLPSWRRAPMRCDGRWVHGEASFPRRGEKVEMTMAKRSIYRLCFAYAMISFISVGPAFGFGGNRGGAVAADLSPGGAW